MSTSSDDPADATPPGASQTTPLPPPIATSPPSSTTATSDGPRLSSAGTPAATPSPALDPTLGPALTPTLPPERTASPAPELDPELDPALNPGLNPARARSAAASRAPIGSRPGDLTPKWRYALVTAWVLAFFAYAAIWQASVQIGIGTWWIGPRAQPTPTLVKVIPSLLTISIAMCAIYNVPRLVRLSAMGVLLATIVAIPDFSRSVSLGVAELVIAGMLGLVTLAALTGRYRLVPDHTLNDPAPDLELSDTTPDAARDATTDAAPSTPAGAASEAAPDAANAGHDGVGGSTNRDAAMGSFAPPDQPRP